MDEVLVCLSTATEADHFIFWEYLAWILLTNTLQVFFLANKDAALLASSIC